MLLFLHRSSWNNLRVIIDGWMGGLLPSDDRVCVLLCIFVIALRRRKRLRLKLPQLATVNHRGWMIRTLRRVFIGLPQHAEAKCLKYVIAVHIDSLIYFLSTPTAGLVPPRWIRNLTLQRVTLLLPFSWRLTLYVENGKKCASLCELYRKCSSRR